MQSMLYVKETKMKTFLQVAIGDLRIPFEGRGQICKQIWVVSKSSER
jgi:hypothetical protein